MRFPATCALALLSSCWFAAPLWAQQPSSGTPDPPIPDAAAGEASGLQPDSLSSVPADADQQPETPSQTEEGGATVPSEATRAARRSSTGLFRERAYTGRERHAVDFETAISGGYDDNLASAVQGGVADPRLAGRGLFGTVTPRVHYEFGGQQSSFGIAGGAQFRQFFPNNGSSATTARAGESASSALESLRFSTELGPRTSIRGSQTLEYSTLSGFSSLPTIIPSEGLQLDPGPDVPATNQFASVLFSGDFELERHLSRTSAVFLYYSGSRVNYPDRAPGDLIFDLHRQTVGASYRRSLTREAALRLGYGYRRGVYGAALSDGRVRGTHDIDIGLDYARALSVTRRTRVGFRTGTTVIAGTTDSTASVGDQGSRLYVSGDAWLEREIGRSWRALAGYERAVKYVEGFAEPFRSDDITMSVGGWVTPRVDVRFSAFYVRGAVGATGTASDFWTRSFSAQMRCALSRNAAIFAEYAYYAHDFSKVVLVPNGFPRYLSRQAAQAGLTMWVPLLRRNR